VIPYQPLFQGHANASEILSMNPMIRQHAIREYELFVSDGVQEIPESVFERETRAAGEYREVRVRSSPVITSAEQIDGIKLSTAVIDLDSGEIVDSTPL
jgi:hypothetical protein